MKKKHTTSEMAIMSNTLGGCCRWASNSPRRGRDLGHKKRAKEKVIRYEGMLGLQSEWELRAERKQGWAMVGLVARNSVRLVRQHPARSMVDSDLVCPWFSLPPLIDAPPPYTPPFSAMHGLYPTLQGTTSPLLFSL